MDTAPGSDGWVNAIKAFPPRASKPVLAEVEEILVGG
jgi:hypothetical protein